MLFLELIKISQRGDFPKHVLVTVASPEPKGRHDKFALKSVFAKIYRKTVTIIINTLHNNYYYYYSIIITTIRSTEIYDVRRKKSNCNIRFRAPDL